MEAGSSSKRRASGRGSFGHLLLVVISLLWVPAILFGKTDTSTAQQSSDPPATQTFETLQPAPAKTLLPAELFKSDHHDIGGESLPDGWWYRYTLDSPFGKFDVLGEDMLRIRVHEVQALAKIDHDMSQPVAFGYGVLDTVISPFKFLWSLITEPKETLTGVPKGMKRVGTRIGEMVTGERGNLDGGEGSELIGYAGVKRTVAAAAGVNVYSSNIALQEQLDRIAVAGYSGGVGSRIAMIPVSGPVGLALTTTSFSRAMNEMLLEYAPEDLRGINREILETIGVRKEIREAFLEHPWYSPRHETILVQALNEMKGVDDRSLALQVAMKVESEEEALFMQRLIEMFASYHQTVVPLGEFILIDDHLLVGYTTDHTLISALPLAHVAWTQEVASAVDTVVRWHSRSHPIRRVELWASGELTPRAQKELTNRGVMLFQKKRERLLPSVLPEPLAISNKVKAVAESEIDTPEKTVSDKDLDKK